MLNSFLDGDFDSRRYAYRGATLNFAGTPRPRASEAFCRLLTELGQFDNIYEDDPEELFWRLCRSVHHNHLVYGRAPMELHLDSKTGEPRLAELPGWSLRRRLGRYQQLVLTQQSRTRWQTLPPRGVVEFNLPGRLSRDLQSISRRLELMDRYDVRSPTRPPSSFDFSEYKRARETLGASITAPIGWDGRMNNFMSRSTQGHVTYRALKYRCTWRQVVDATLDTLNALTASIGPPSTEPFTIALTGIPTVAELQTKMKAVVTGEEPLDAIRDAVL